MKKLFKKLFPRFMECKVILDDCGSPYLIRLTIFELFTGHSLKLHHIIRSDREREPHDHPWSFYTFMLSGGYFEETPVTIKGYKLGDPTQKHWHAPGTFRFVKNPYPHRLDLARDVDSTFPAVTMSDEAAHALFQNTPREIPAVTLVFTFPKARRWGFYTKRGWINSGDFINDREC